MEEKSITIHRLRKLFGFKTERSSDLSKAKPDNNNPETKPDQNTEEENANESDIESSSDDTQDEDVNGDKDKSDNKLTRKGSTFSIKDYKSAIITEISHERLKLGFRCPVCQRGNLYRVNPGVFLRIVGQPWLQAHIYNRERFRCNTCGKTFTAKMPEDIARAPKFEQLMFCLLLLT